MTWDQHAPDDVAAITELLDDTMAMLARFVAFPSTSAQVAVTLWAAHTHVLEAFESTPRLALLSPEKQSGKTRTLEVLELICPKPMHAVNCTPAALFRAVAASAPTLLFDEADTYFGPRAANNYEELRGLINAGHRRGAVAYRCVGPQQEVKEFPAFAAVALAGIGDLPDTITDRAVVIAMRRRAPHERLDDFRERKARPEGHALRDRYAKWATANVEVVAELEPVMPAGITDRPADVWEPLLALAELAGPAWGARARTSAVELNSSRAKADTSLGVRLLLDIHKLVGDYRYDDEAGKEQHHPGQTHVFTEELLEKLNKVEESPWGDIRGKALDARGLSRRLSKYGIGPKQVRIGEVTRKGYDRGDFADAWVRYLGLESPGSETRETSETTDEETSRRREVVSPVSDVSLLRGTEPPAPGAGAAPAKVGAHPDDVDEDWTQPLLDSIANRTALGGVRKGRS